MRTITEVHEVPKPGSAEHKALCTLIGLQETENNAGFLVGFTAGKATARLPEGARVVRVVVVAEVDR